MSGNVFLDTNILVYLYSTSEALKRNNSEILFSEDMGDDHVIESKLKIINPYKDS